MNIADVTPGERGFTVEWDDRSIAEFPFIWLRDNAPEEFHPHTRERIFDLTSVDLDIAPESFTADSGALAVKWPQKDGPSVYAAGWLHRHRPGQRRYDPSVVDRVLWDADTLGVIPRSSASQCIARADALRDALHTLKRYGILIIDGVDDSPDASRAFGELIGLRRRTNFGDIFEVVSRPQPNNLAYTALAIPLHIDLPNQEIIPGYQLLHCYRNSAAGGESVFADGFRICEDLRRDAPDDYELLSEVEIPFRFHDEEHDIRRRRPMICEGADGSLDYFVFNAHIADVPDLDAGTLYAFYAAYQRLMKRVRQSGYAIRHALQPGEMILFDNTRVLHGRTAFDPGSGERHLYGYYMERNEIDSRIRVLARSSATEE